MHSTLFQCIPFFLVYEYSVEQMGKFSLNSSNIHTLVIYHEGCLHTPLCRLYPTQYTGHTCTCIHIATSSIANGSRESRPSFLPILDCTSQWRACIYTMHIMQKVFCRNLLQSWNKKKPFAAFCLTSGRLMKLYQLHTQFQCYSSHTVLRAWSSGR